MEGRHETGRQRRQGRFFAFSRSIGLLAVLVLAVVLSAKLAHKIIKLKCNKIFLKQAETKTKKKQISRHLYLSHSGPLALCNPVFAHEKMEKKCADGQTFNV